jgi:hypothetical protein
MMCKRSIDRRAFVVTLVTGIAVVSILPSRLPAALVAEQQSAPAPYSKSGPLSDWTVDDMTGAYPRYAESIGYGRTHNSGTGLASPLDHLFLA